MLSAFGGRGDRLAYIHEPGLIMRHDKEAFAKDAMAAAHVGQLVADYERILLFSAYAQVLGQGADSIKKVIDPFTGCFVSGLPTTVVHLRFALKVATMFAAGDAETASQFVRQGARRIPKVLGFVRGQNSQLKQQYEAERAGWNLF